MSDPSVQYHGVYKYTFDHTSSIYTFQRSRTHTWQGARATTRRTHGPHGTAPDRPGPSPPGSRVQLHASERAAPRQTRPNRPARSTATAAANLLRQARPSKRRTAARLAADVRGTRPAPRPEHPPTTALATAAAARRHPLLGASSCPASGR